MINIMRDNILRGIYRFFVSGFFVFGLMWTSSGCEKEHKSVKNELPLVSSTEIETKDKPSVDTESTGACVCTEWKNEYKKGELL